MLVKRTLLFDTQSKRLLFSSIPDVVKRQIERQKPKHITVSAKSKRSK